MKGDLDSFAEMWRNKTDQQLLDAASRLADFTEGGQKALQDELERRKLQFPVQHSDLKSARKRKVTDADNKDAAFVEMSGDTTDDELVAAASHLADQTEIAQRSLRAELQKRGLGLPLQVLTTAPNNKSKASAVILALLFGPLGMLYVNRFLRSSLLFLAWLIIAMVAVFVKVGGGGTFLLGLGLFAMWLLVFPIWAAHRVDELNEPVRRPALWMRAKTIGESLGS